MSLVLSEERSCLMENGCSLDLEEQEGLGHSTDLKTKTLRPTFPWCLVHDQCSPEKFESQHNRSLKIPLA